ncbi:MAG: sodium:glutamate symporter [Lachnospiraceae bacterium]|nr:sodium:glutamate symporter [Lachnospiraceae bacterium]
MTTVDYSANNIALWNAVVQMGIIAATILFANLLRRRFKFIRMSMMPTAVLGGLLLLLVKVVMDKCFDITFLNNVFLEKLTYHGIAVGFIAMSLRVPERDEKQPMNHVGLRSGATIVSSYMIQGIFGLAISLALAYTVMPDLFKAAGVLLPLGYGQGPGQANNTGSVYQNDWGFAGGRSFGLAIAAAGYLSACIVGVWYLNHLLRKGKIKKLDQEVVDGSVTVDRFQHRDEMPVAESLDRLSMQFALVLLVYLITYLATWGITSGLSAISEGLGKTLNGLLWGFNFMIGSGIAIGARVLLKNLKKHRVMEKQYQNNYLLSRISGLAFDIMIIAGIASIDIEDLKGLWLPFALMVVAGATVTLFNLKYVCKRIYPTYYYEGLVSMYGMMTGTISSGVLLLREVDPQLETPAANNLVIGSSFAILLGAPLLVLIGMAPKSALMTWITLGIMIAYYIVLLLIACGGSRKFRGEEKAE